MTTSTPASPRPSSISAEGTHRGALRPVDWSLLLSSGPALGCVVPVDRRGACVVLGVFDTVIAFVLMTTLAARVGPTRASALTYVEAAAALGLGLAIRGDHVSTIEVVGCATVLAGAWFTGRAEH